MSRSSEHFDVAAYALGVLDDGDTEAFERHLDVCPACREELALFCQVPALLDEATSERTIP
ncbi:zf-HC2 domain-containing protein [Streptosporangiaceae bacterium NEAU-GS5]|nr:zf-HC2 domain-containing protein [Streptosporangiaceae bacterium NEAU-GS5]